MPTALMRTRTWPSGGSSVGEEGGPGLGWMNGLKRAAAVVPAEAGQGPLPGVWQCEQLQRLPWISQGCTRRSSMPCRTQAVMVGIPRGGVVGSRTLQVRLEDAGRKFKRTMRQAKRDLRCYRHPPAPHQQAPQTVASLSPSAETSLHSYCNHPPIICKTRVTRKSNQQHSCGAPPTAATPSNKRSCPAGDGCPAYRACGHALAAGPAGGSRADKRALTVHVGHSG